MKMCDTCRWFSMETRRYMAECSCPQSDWACPEDARTDENDCGPSGRYWEPKDDATE